MTMTLFADPSGTLGKIQIGGVDVLSISNAGVFSTPSLLRLNIANKEAGRFIATGDRNLYLGDLGGTGAILDLSADSISGANGVTIAAGFAAGGYGPMVFKTAATEAMRIHTNQQIKIGGVTNYSGKVEISFPRASLHGIALRPDADSGAGNPITFLNAAATGVGSITTTSSATAYNTSSDPRLKNTIAPLTGSGAIIDALNPVTWLWNSDNSPGAGFLAPDFQAVFPRAVTGIPDEVDVDLNPVYQMLDASTPEVMAVIVAELQDIRARLLAGGL